MGESIYAVPWVGRPESVTLYKTLAALVILGLAVVAYKALDVASGEGQP